MRDLIRVLLLGTGQMGSGIARLLLDKQGVELVGAYGRRAGRAGMDVGSAVGLDHMLGIRLGNDLEALIRETRPDVAIQATCSHIGDAMAEIGTLVDQGVCVISIAEEMAYPVCSAPDFAARIHRRAVSNRVAVLGTGVNPGFVLDLLVITLSAVCASIDAITARRVNDLSPYGPAVLNAQGVGLTPAAFREGVAQGTVVGHIGFPESVHMIAGAIGWEIERIEEQREPIVASVRRETAEVTVEPGQVAGCLHRAVAYRAGKPVITLIHPQQVRPELEGEATGDSIEIDGTPPVRLGGSPEIAGGAATIALAVNMIPRVLDAAPGLYTMADLPVPHAVLGDLRKHLHRAGR